jgi:hypothetical protein
MLSNRVRKTIKSPKVDLLSFIIQKEKTTIEKIWLNEKMYVIDLDTEKKGIA